MKELSEQEKLAVMFVAALFRAAAIAGGTESDEKHNNSDAIDKAKEFVNACKANGVWPEKVDS